MIISYDKITLFGETLFGRRIDDASSKTCPQVLEEAYFFYIRRGKCTVYSERAKLSLSRGQSAIMQGGMYVGHIFPESDLGEFEAVSIRFHQDILKKIYQHELPDFLSTNEGDNRLAMEKLGASELIDSYIQGIVYYFNHQKLITPNILSLKIQEIILLLLQTENAPKIRRILQSPMMKRRLSFIQIIDSHIYADLNLKELAHLTSMSLSSFKRHFAREFNTTPNQYFLSKRLERAKYLLENSDQPISDIAFTSGFKTASHFSSKFREKYQASPSAIRMNLTKQ